MGMVPTLICGSIQTCPEILLPCADARFPAAKWWDRMSQRGTPIINFDTRVTKTIKFTESLKLGLFAEFYNITNRANFGAYYVGNSRASNFRLPFAFQVGLPTSRQLQLGGRFSF